MYGDTVMDREECEPPPALTPTGAFSTCHIALTSSRVVQGKCFSLINYYYYYYYYYYSVVLP